MNLQVIPVRPVCSMNSRMVLALTASENHFFRIVRSVSERILSRAGPELTCEKLDGSGFSRARRPKKTKNLPFLHGKAQAVQRPGTAEGKGYVLHG